MRYWLTRDEPTLKRAFVKRFDASHWLVDFPRGSMASVVSRTGECELTVTATFGGKADLVGLIYRSDDEGIHVGHRRQVDRDYRRCRLQFRWQSTGVIPLDQPNGPTLTIEGWDSENNRQTWYVRLWNYADGSPDDAVVTLDFDALDAGYSLSSDAIRVDPTSIDRMFISLVPPGFEAGSLERYPVPLEGEVRVSDITVSGSGSVLVIGDTFTPEHRLRVCTSYDDCYNLTPERVIDSIERLGYRSVINHYVGMSHFPALRGDGNVDEGSPMCAAARRWHESFATIAAERGYQIIWSVSMELLDQICPDHWKQRDFTGQPAKTGYSPPSTLLSPASTRAVEYIGDVASAFVSIGVEAGLVPQFQIGEPWWWLNDDRRPCIYDAHAVTSWPDHQAVEDIDGPLSTSQHSAIEMAGEMLAEATSAIVAKVKQVYPEACSHLLVYLPTIWDVRRPARASLNLPTAWHAPAFDVLQLEDYEWVGRGRMAYRQTARNAVLDRLGMQPENCHYLSGFAQGADPPSEWAHVIGAAAEAFESGVAETFVWALPQIMRDSLTIFEGEVPVKRFHDVSFPLELGLDLEVAPTFSTTIATSIAGFEHRNANWSQSRLRFNVGSSVRSVEDLQTLVSFYREMHGSAGAFRLRDPFDHNSGGADVEPSATDVVLGTGDGETVTFALQKIYGEGERRRITRPVPASVVVAIDGSVTTDWFLGEAGIVEFIDPPSPAALVTAGFTFDVPVRFEADELRVNQGTYRAGECLDVRLIEVREE